MALLGLCLADDECDANGLHFVIEITFQSFAFWFLLFWLLRMLLAIDQVIVSFVVGDLSFGLARS